MCTEEVNNVAYLFETTSEGVLTRDCVPGSCVLYIRDTLKSTILWSRQDPNDQEAEVIENVPEVPLIDPKPEEPDVFPDAVEGDPARLSGGPVIITKEDLVQDILMPEPSAPLALQDATASDFLPEEAPVLDQRGIATPPESRKREADEVSVTVEVEEEADFDADDEIPEEAAPLHYASAPPQPKAVPLALPPAPRYGWPSSSVPALWVNACLGCGAHIVRPPSQKQRKRIKTARWFAGGSIEGIRQAHVTSSPPRK